MQGVELCVNAVYTRKECARSQTEECRWNHSSRRSVDSWAACRWARELSLIYACRSMWTAVQEKLSRRMRQQYS